ncbi:MAG: CcmD family protein [Chitinophagaceae bacterium]|nr:CcmD family protein [Chitinophagaceae bacterium]
MKHLKKILLFALTACTSVVVAQSDKPVEMADLMRSNGKIYIVVAICLTILIGLFLYVWNVDRKISKLEKEG